MRVIWLVGVFCIGLFGVEVKKVEFISDAESHEVILEFDSDYTLTPKEKETNGYRALVFEGVSGDYKTRRNERIKDSFLTEIQIFNLSDEGLHILGAGDSKEFSVNASRAQNTWKVSFNKVAPPLSALDQLLETPRPAQNFTTTQSETNLAEVEMPPSNPPSPRISEAQREPMSLDLWRYFALVGVMLLLIAALLWLRSSMKKDSNVKNFTNIFGASRGGAKGNLPDGFDSNLKIIAQKKLDAKNKILTIETNGYRYLVLMGQHNNTIIDRFKIVTNTPNNNGVNINNLIIEDTQFAKLLEKKEQRIKQLKSQSV